MFTSLSFSPTSATQTELHRYTDRKTRKTISLDDLLDDFSPAELDRQRAFYQEFQRRLQRIAVDRLDPQTQVDFDLLDNAVALALFSLDKEQFYRWKPQLYPENLGNALFGHVSLEYADTATRARHLVARLEKVPGFLAQAMENLQRSNEVYRRVALESVQGVEDLVKRVGADFVRGTPSESRYAAAQGTALVALAHYATFLGEELPKRGEVDWGIGLDRFDTSGSTIAGVAASCRHAPPRGGQPGTTPVEMLPLSRPLHSQWFPDHRHDDNDSAQFLNQIVGEVLAWIGEEHTHRDSFLQQVRRTPRKS